MYGEEMYGGSVYGGGLLQSLVGKAVAIKYNLIRLTGKSLTITYHLGVDLVGKSVLLPYNVLGTIKAHTTYQAKELFGGLFLQKGIGEDQSIFEAKVVQESAWITTDSSDPTQYKE